MKIIFKITAFIAIACILMTCHDEFPKSPYPRIETLTVINVTEKGATFQGNIIQLGNSPIIDHGFLWGKTENLSMLTDEKVQLGTKTNLGRFEADLISGLEKNKKYYVTAYVATVDYFVYGNEISFIIE